MRNKEITRDFYINSLGFEELSNQDFSFYFMCRKDEIELHFFEFKDLDPLENYGQVYIRTDDIKEVYHYLNSQKLKTSPLERKPWQQFEFSILDPDHNLLTFGQNIL